MPSRPASAPSRRPRWTRREWLAMAASVVVGMALALALPPRLRPRDDAGLAASLVDGHWFARGVLARALDAQLSGGGDATVRLGLSFRALDGHYCRVFGLRSPRPMSGLACREDGQWRVSTLAAAGVAGDATSMRQAASALPPAVAADVDARIAGESLDAMGERRARATGWR
jgi:hypothetical protein